MTIYDKVCEMLGLPKIGLGLGEVRKAFEEQEHPRGKNGRFVEKGEKVSVDFGYLSDIDRGCIDYLFDNKFTFAISYATKDYYFVRRIGTNKIALCISTKIGKRGCVLTVKDKKLIDYLGIPVDVKKKNVYNKNIKSVVVPDVNKLLRMSYKVPDDDLDGYMGSLFRKVEQSCKYIPYKVKRSVCVACEVVNKMIGRNFTKDIDFCCEAGDEAGAVAFYNDYERRLSLSPLYVDDDRIEAIGIKNDNHSGRCRMGMATDNGLGVVSVIIHELGHAIDDFDDKELQDKHYITFFHSCEKNACPSIYGGGGKRIPYIEGEVQTLEFFAECFANYVLKLNDMTAEQQAMIESRLNTVIEGGQNGHTNVWTGK